jgi:hypothetical protein
MSEEQLPEECCAKCRFWWRNASDTYGEQDGVYGDNRFAPCRRFPKVFTGEKKQFAYDDWDHPVMIDDDWCGEFQPRKEPAT